MTPLPGRKRTAVLLVSLAAHFVLALICAAVAAWAILQFETNASFDDRQLSDDVYIVILTLRMLFFIVGGIAFLMWLHRSYANAQTLTGTKHTPAMVIVSFFVPFIQLVKPYQAIQEMWRSSGATARNSRLILTWWLSFLVWESMFFILIDEMPEIELPTRGWWIAASISDLFGVLAAALGFWMVRSIRQRQRSQAGGGTTTPSYAMSAAIEHSPTSSALL